MWDNKRENEIESRDKKEIAEIAKSAWDRIWDFAFNYSKLGFIQSLMWWWLILLVVMTLTWTPLSSITNHYFELKKLEISQTFELQKQSLEYMKTEITPQLNQIIKRLDNVDKRLDNVDLRINVLEGKIFTIERDFSQHKLTGK